jgi:hypothetical protein
MIGCIRNSERRNLALRQSENLFRLVYFSMEIHKKTPSMKRRRLIAM